MPLAMLAPLRRPLTAALLLLTALPLAAACSGDGEAKPGPTPAQTVDLEAIKAHTKTTLEDLAAFAPKIAGTEGGIKTGDYVKGRFEKAGLSDVHFEPFSFLSYSIDGSSLDVKAGDTALPMKHEVFHYSGTGKVDADIVDVGKGREEDYTGKDVTGKIVLVERDPTFHRQGQYNVVAKHGGAAMLFISTSPDNLIQIGTVTDPEDAFALIPTVTIGADDGAKIRAAMAAGQTAHAALEVKASVSPGTGRNVIGKLPGTDPSGAYIVLGAHYDAWYTGSTDNGTGVAALLEIAETLSARKDRRLGVVFVGYDGEELGLFGGYDYLRKHVIVGGEPMLAFLNLEQPTGFTSGSGLRAVAHTHGGAVDPAAIEAELSDVYRVYVGMEIIPGMFGGFIPTDIQGMYWYGMQGMSTFCETPYYHTPQDTPDKVDLGFLADGVDYLLRFMNELDASPVASFAQRDDQVWTADVSTKPSGNGDLTVDVAVADIHGAAQGGANVRVWLDVDDFTRAADLHVVADAAGKASATIPQAALQKGKGSRWIHVTAGAKFPQAERIVPVP